MKIALAQINTTVGDLSGNFNKMIKYIERAKNNNCDLIVFPELVITGYPPEDLLYKENFIEDAIAKDKLLARYSNEIAIIYGNVYKKDNKLFNSGIICNKGTINRVYKILLPNYSVFDEKRYFNPGREVIISEIKGELIGVNICEDIWFPEISKKQSELGADIIVNISCSPYYKNKLREREEMLIQRAKETKTYICYCNLVGGQDELVFDGGSMVLDCNGDIILESSQFSESLSIVDLDLNNKPLSNLHKDINLEVWEALKLGLKDYMSKNGFSKAVLGVSGGIDSALVATLAVSSLGKDNVLCLSMPSKYNSNETKSDAKQLCKYLGCQFKEIPLSNVINSYIENLALHNLDLTKGLAGENIQARIRGNIVMAFSNAYNYLPLACGNKSEYAVGYATIYGDMCGGFAPIKDIPKTLVYQLAKWLNSKKEIIPNSIIEREPSAELRDNQKDRDSLPEYDNLDKMIEKYIERNQSIDKRIAKMIDRSEYKRRQAPIGIKITKRTFDKDYRMPIVNKYQKNE